MPANNVVVATSTDFDNIRSSLKSFLASQPQFTDYNFDGSVLSMIVDLLALNTYYNAFYTSAAYNEAFLDSAQLRSNVVSKAKALSYTPRSARGASTTLNITINPDDSPTSIVIAKNTQWTATVDQQTLFFVTPQSYVVTANNGAYTKTITIVEGRPLTHRYTVNNSNPVRYIIPNSNVDLTSLAVTVENSSSDSTSTPYTLADDITQVTATSPVFWVEEIEDQQYEIFFGDRVIGKQLSHGNIVVLNYRVCNDVAGNAINSFVGPSSVGGYSDYSLTVNAVTAGGAAIQSIDSVKFTAPKSYAAQNRCVIDDDYRRVIINNFGDVATVSVWGGEDNTPALFGKVFISVKPVTGTTLSQQRKDDIKRTIKRYNVMSIDPEFVDPSYLYIRSNTAVRYDSGATTLSADDVQDKVLTAIESFENTKLGTFDATKFRYSQFIRAIDNADPSIVASLSSITLEKRFVPSTTTTAQYVIAFNNAISNPHDENHSGHTSHSGNHAISSSSFIYQGQTCYFDDDGEGNLRIYYNNVGANTVVYVDERAGTINYATGVITITAWKPTSFTGSEVSIYAKPLINDVTGVRNQILVLGTANVTVVDDNTNNVAAVTRAATTTGVTVTTTDDGIYPIVY